ncbi:hypothetical protein IRJ16_22165 [Mucilaginibacter myungsuensis]|uniref:Glycoside hydrolase family 2 catalytic domain-containing protein n=1 Tax=Mucilaginibacter myungsuensis TaxID=649104 RepID=A0A929L1V3_9SPHI|nr:hypothetical protein [Mucilaginibacter myungsuensis]
MFYPFFLLLFFSKCSDRHPSPKGQAKVYINSDRGRYQFYRNGKPFIIKGGAGFTHLKELKAAGGNTIRVWDTTKLQHILDSAQVYGLGVIVGLPMPSNQNMDLFYNNKNLVSKGHKHIMATVNRYKNHPALLCWCLGNELPFPYKPTFNKFYNAFNQLVDDIHRNDPGHPVTTTLMSFQQKNIVNIRSRTNIDFISFNIFGSIKTLKADLERIKWFWSGPYLITEWGIEGPWVSDSQNAWGAYVENTSEKKAEQILDTYRKYMPVTDPRFLGSMIFYWGQKQELTPTWFSLFDRNGHKTSSVDIMQQIWTGKPPAKHPPAIKYMLLDGKGGNDNILLSPRQLSSARILMSDKDTALYSYHWELMKEDWYKPNNIFNEKPQKPIKGSLLNDRSTSVKFSAPVNEGPYRLFVYVYDNTGYVATANTPFYVVDNP